MFYDQIRPSHELKDRFDMKLKEFYLVCIKKYVIQQNSNVNMYLETLMEHNILPYICIPTRLTDNTSTVIDHINVRIPINQIHTKISSGNIINDISDHLPNYFIMDSNITKIKDRPLIRLCNEKKN